MLASLGNYILYLSSTLVTLAIAVVIYVRVTPFDEFALIRSGNVAAAVALAGTLIGYAAVVYAATTHGSTLLETLVWSAISLIGQIIAFEIVQLVLRDLRVGMERGELSYGIALGGVSIAIGIINAACLTP
jgi:putative membrane protein